MDNSWFLRFLKLKKDQFFDGRIDSLTKQPFKICHPDATDGSLRQFGGTC